MKRDRPIIIFDNSARHRNSPIRANFEKQNLLLKGMMIHAGDLKQASKYAGIKTMAEAYRTLDRLAIRKGYYEALDRHDISLDFIVQGIKDVAVNGSLDSVRLKAFQVLLKTLGLETYGKDEEGGKGWEEIVAKAVKDKESATDKLPVPGDKYVVNVPKVPEDESLKRKHETDLGRELYEG